MGRLLDPTGTGERPTSLGPIQIGAIVLQGGRARVDHGALHGRSQIESGLEVRDGPPAGERVALVWVAFRGGAFHGLGASVIFVDRDRKAVFRSPAQQANRMAAAARGEVAVAELSDSELATLRAFLQSSEPVLWDSAPAPFKAALARKQG